MQIKFATERAVPSSRNIIAPAADAVRAVEKEVPVAHCGLGVLIDGDDDGLHMRVTVPLARRQVADLGECPNPGPIFGVGFVPFCSYALEQNKNELQGGRSVSRHLRRREDQLQPDQQEHRPPDQVHEGGRRHRRGGVERRDREGLEVRHRHLHRGHEGRTRECRPRVHTRRRNRRVRS